MNIVLLSHHTETHALTECGDNPVLVNYEKSFIMNEPPGRGTALPLEKDVRNVMATNQRIATRRHRTDGYKRRTDFNGKYHLSPITYTYTDTAFSSSNYT